MEAPPIQLRQTTILSFLLSSPKGICCCLFSFPQPKQNGCPILRALCEGWDVNTPPPTEPLPLPLPFCCHPVGICCCRCRCRCCCRCRCLFVVIPEGDLLLP